MKKPLGTALLSCGLLLTTLACHAGATRIDRQDCGLSFETPRGWQQLDIADARLEPGVTCVIAFTRAGASAPAEVGQPEGWREIADYVLEVKPRPLRDAAQEVGLNLGAADKPQLAPAPPSASVAFKLTKAEQQALPHGELALAETEATKRPPSMVRNGTTGQLILVAGNEGRSVAFVHWQSARNAQSGQDAAALTSLFKSIAFDTDN